MKEELFKMSGYSFRLPSSRFIFAIHSARGFRSDYAEAMNIIALQTLLKPSGLIVGETCGFTVALADHCPYRLCQFFHQNISHETVGLNKSLRDIRLKSQTRAVECGQGPQSVPTPKEQIGTGKAATMIDERITAHLQ